eukprot:Sdes_comp20905_c0_seq1m18105
MSYFPVENRDILGESANLLSLKRYFLQTRQHLAGKSSSTQSLSFPSVLDCFSDFHFLLFLATHKTFTFRENLHLLKPLLDCISTRQYDAAEQWRQTSPDWLTVEHILDGLEDDSYAVRGVSSEGENASSYNTASLAQNAAGDLVAGRAWTCSHCTFLNSDGLAESCEICGLPTSR